MRIGWKLRIHGKPYKSLLNFDISGVLGISGAPGWPENTKKEHTSIDFVRFPWPALGITKPLLKPVEFGFFRVGGVPEVLENTKNEHTSIDFVESANWTEIADSREPL